MKNSHSYINIAVLALYGLLLSFGVVIVIVIIPFLFRGFDYVLPGISVAGLDIGIKRIDDGVRLIDEYWNSSSKIIVTDGLNKWSTTPKSLGLTVDSLETAELAYQIGYKLDTVKLISMFWGWSDEKVIIPPVVTTDPEILLTSLEGLAQIIYQAPKNASIDNSNGSFLAVKGEYGTQLDVQNTYQSILKDPRIVYISGYLILFTEPIPPEHLTLSEPIIEELDVLINDPPTVKVYDPITNERFEYPIEMSSLGSVVTIDEDVEHISYQFVPVQIDTILSHIEQGLIEQGKYLDRTNAIEKFQDISQKRETGYFIVRHNGFQYKAKPGETLLSIAWENGINYWRIVEANPGLKDAGVIVGNLINIPSKDEQLPLPVVIGKRIVVTLKDQRLQAYENGSEIMNELISTGIENSPTQPGIFQVQTHDPYAYASNWDLWMPNFIGIYEAWPGFMNGFHALPILSNGSRLWAGSLGRPVSYGCIILDIGAAQWLYDWADPGVVVEIRP